MRKRKLDNSVIIKRLWALVKPYRGRAFLSLLAMALTAVTQPLLAWGLQVLTDEGFKQPPGFPLWYIPVGLVSLFLIRGIGTFGTAYYNNWIISRVTNDMRAQMFDRLLRLPVGRFHEESTGKIINTVVGDVRQVVDMVNSVFVSAVRDTLTVIGLVAALLWQNWLLTAVALVVVPLTAVITRTTSKRLRHLNRENQRVTAEMTQVVEEATRGHQVIRVFSGERHESRRFFQRSEALRGFSQRMTVAFAATTPVTQIATSLALSVVILLALKAGMTSGEFFRFVTQMLLLLTPLKALAEVNGPMQRGIAAAETVFELIDAPAEPDPGTRTLARAQGRVTFENVSFRYPNAHALALDHVSLEARPGQTVALVGMSGGGKSTFVNLATRFYEPESGRILLDGVPYQDIRMASLRAQLALVSQNVVLFDDTLRANIAYGVEHIDDARLRSAIRAAHLDDVVARLPDGVDTLIGENGLRLSGGQRQRVAIARAIYKDAPILILDEATSALDNESERAVQAALDTLMAGRTTFVIAHRLSTIEGADLIVVMEHGRIVEQGTHDELLAKGGMYANLYRLQFANAVEMQ